MPFDEGTAFFFTAMTTLLSPRASGLALCLLLLSGPCVWSQESASSPFVGGLSEAERAAIGLEALTPAQQAALEAAVERYVAGRSEELVAEVTTEVRTEMAAAINQEEQRRVEAEKALATTQAELAEKEREVEAAREEVAAVKEEDDTSLLERAKVLLTPGTKVEYVTVESRLAREFKGWDIGTIFRLENGQAWKVTSGKYWSPREGPGKAVTITPGSMGSFHMKLEGVKPTPKVELVSRN